MEFEGEFACGVFLQIFHFEGSMRKLNMWLSLIAEKATGSFS